MDDADGKTSFCSMICKDVNMQSVMTDLVYKIQKDFCEEIQKLEEYKTFSMNKWKSSEDAGGITQVLEGGDVFEKVGVYTSIAKGILSTSTFFLLKGRNGNETIPVNPTYFTAGINGVAYAKNPHVPTLNFSYRYFEIKNGDECIWWFGGGTDLTPYILNVHDCQHFHSVLKICCDEHDKHYYRTFKKSCDEHLYLVHRGERRGIGGIFFNDLNFPNKETCFQFVYACMKNILPSYIPIVMRNKDKKYFSQDKEWQLIQRGRYVEFYFICDKTTKLALLTPGVEQKNVLICLPPLAKWPYNYVPAEKSKESELLNVLRHPVEWV